jgi:hypothetical protein
VKFQAAAKSCKQDQYSNENETALHVYRPWLKTVAGSGRPVIIKPSNKLLFHI